MNSKADAKIVAIVLAAGAARRFGRPKQLERWPAPAGPTLLERALANAQAGGADEIIVVTGNAAAAIEAIGLEWAQGASYNYRAVFNPRWQEGQGFSVAAGVQVLRSDVAAVIFFLADQPRLAPSTGAALVAAFRTVADENTIIFPVYGGKRGNPVVFGRAHFAALARLEGDVGGRAVVKAHPECVREIEVNDPAIHEDVDTPQDLSNL